MPPTLTDCRVVVFDFDGVLVESVDVKTQAFAKLYEPYGKHIEDAVVEHHQSHGGMSRYEKFRHWHRTLLGIELTKADEDALAEQFSALVEDAVVHAPYVEGAVELLHKLSLTLPLFVASATPEEELRRILDRRGMKKFFVDAYGSPHRKESVLRELARGEACLSADVVMIGDSLSDYEAALGAKTKFIGRVRRDDRNPFPSQVGTVTTLTELLP